MKVHIFNYRICTIFNPESHLLSIQWFNGDNQKAAAFPHTNESTDPRASQSPIHLTPIKDCSKSRVPWSNFLYTVNHCSIQVLHIMKLKFLLRSEGTSGLQQGPDINGQKRCFFLQSPISMFKKRNKTFHFALILASSSAKSARNSCMGNGAGLEILPLINRGTIQSKISWFCA